MGSDIVTELVTQLPAIFYIQICGTFFLLAALMAFFVNRRSQKRHRELVAAAAAAAREEALNARVDDMGWPDDPPAPRSSQRSIFDKMDTKELPPLDLLVGDEPPPDAKPLTPAVSSAPARLRLMPEDQQYLRLHNADVSAAQEVLTVFRDADDGRLIVQMGATAYRSLADAPEAKKSFTRLMKELGDTILKADPRPTGHNALDGQALEAESAREPETPPVMSPAEPASAPPPAEPMPEAAPDSYDFPPPPALPNGTMPGDLPSYKMDDNPVKWGKGRGGRAKAEFTPPPDFNIPAAIEEYVQYKLQFTPQVRGRNIHVKPALHGGVRIEVDNASYEAVDDVNDPMVRAFLRAAIDEWQERNG